MWRIPFFNGFRSKTILLLLSILLLVFLVSRVSLYAIYFDVFKTLSIKQLLMAFISGFKFDLATVATFFGIPIFMLSFPVPSRKWFKFWLIVSLAELIAVFLILVSDIIFFEHVKRHIGDEIRLISNDMDFIFKFALNGYMPVLLAIALISSALFFIINRAVNRWYKRPGFKPLKDSLKIIALAAFLIMSVRGWTFHGKPVNVVDAFDYSSSEYGNLVLNGVFTSYQSSRSSRDINHSFFEPDAALQTARKLVVEKDEIPIDSKMPLMRAKPLSRAKSPVWANAAAWSETEKFNVVFLFLESWSHRFIDSFSGSKNGATGNFDKIAENGLMFTNFHANGQRSIFGIEATLAGIPAIPGIPYLGKGLEISNITRLGGVLKDYGYSTLMMQTSRRGSYRLEGIASALGFEEYYGSQDIPIVYPYDSGKEPTWGYDYDGLMFLSGRLDVISKPFFAFFFSGTTHSPFVPLDKKFEKYPRSNDYDYNSFLNTLNYSDYSIGEFFAKAKNSQWFDNTIFILTADHTLGQFQDNTLDDKFKIPLVIYCPRLFNHKKFDTLGSQTDILPTVFDLLGLEAPYSALGKSLLGDYDKRFVFFVEGDNIGLITDKGYLKHSLKNRLETSLDDANDADAAEKELLSLDQTIYTLLRENRWYGQPSTSISR